MIDQGKPYVYRFRVPFDREIVVDDLVLGEAWESCPNILDRSQNSMHSLYTFFAYFCSRIFGHKSFEWQLTLKIALVVLASEV